MVLVESETTAMNGPPEETIASQSRRRFSFDDTYAGTLFLFFEHLMVL